MAALGTTDSPSDLVPGEPAEIYQCEAELRAYGDALLSAGDGLQRIDTTGGWSGAAADAFRQKFHEQPLLWIKAGDAFHDAADAMGRYVETLVWAQGQAADAISTWNAGHKAAAVTTLNSAQSQLASAGNTAAGEIASARDMAPPGPGFWSRFGSDLSGIFSEASRITKEVAETGETVLASLANATVHDVGSVAEVLGGLSLATVSAGGEAGGFLLDATGIGAILGVPANVISAAGIATGLGLAGTGMSTIMRDAAGPDRVNMMSSDGGTGSGSADPADGMTNRSRPPVEGDTNYVVDNPDDISDTVTDIDQVKDGTLWEEKTATGQNPNMDTQAWVNKHVVTKLSSYVRARQYLPGWENAPLGLDFTEPGATPEFKAAVEQAVEQFKAANPGVQVTVRWAS
jgi:hypothetical protein